MRTRGAQWLLAGIAGALVASSCSTGQTSNTPSHTLVYASPALATSVDPCNNTGGTNSEIINNLYGFWVNYKNIPGSDNILLADTASGEQGVGSGIFASWDVSADGTVYTMHLREGLKDSYGAPFTADDAYWVLDRIQHSTGCPWVAGSENITDVSKQVKVIDAKTLQITLPAPNAIFLRMLAVNNGMAIGATARKHTTSSDPWANDWMKQNAPALGPYKLDKWTPGVEMVLSRNPNWWGAKPYYDKVVYRQVPTSSNRVALLLNGQANVARDLSQDELDQVAKSDRAYNACVAGNDFVYLPLNLAEGQPTANLKVRQALAYAIPYDEIVTSVYRGRAKKLYGAFPSSYADYIGDSAYPYKTDLAKAKQLLSEAGYPNGFNTTMTLNNSRPTDERMAVLVQNNLKQIGISVSIDSKPDAAYTTAVFNRQFGGMTIYDEHSYVLDFAYHSLIWFSTPGQKPPNFNMTGFSDPRFDQVVAGTVKLADGPQRKQLVQSGMQILIDKLPIVPLANDPTCFSFSKDVTGYVYRPFDQVGFADLKGS